MTMNFELLPNEILLDVFGYLGGISLLRAFYGLNVRFNLLLYKQFRAYCFYFSWISKPTFDMICQQHLSFLADRITDLSLCDCEATPGQINLFLSYMPSFAQFTHLRSLKLFHLRSYQILIKIVNDFYHLCNLTHLYLDSCDCQNDQVDFQFIFNSIWSLPKLTHCYFDVCLNKKTNFCLPTKLSTSLKDLYIFHYKLRKYTQIHQLMDFATRLKCLRITIDSDGNEDYQPSPLPTLINLAVGDHCISDTSKMITLLQNVPNLRRLYAYLPYILINGYQWEQVIRKYLLKLKIFQFSMNGELSIGQNIIERADELLNSFRSPFWIDEHQWFVRCAIYNRTIQLQTLLDTYYHFEKTFPVWWKSTYADDDREKFHNTMSSIYHEAFFDQPVSAYLRLENITHLCLKLPITDKLWSIVPSLDQLQILSVSSYDDSFQSQLQTLLDRTPHLRSLSISQNFALPLQTSLFQYTNVSVPELDVCKCNPQFNEEECLALTRSPLGRECEILSIQVKNRESILILVQNMINLQALHVECENETDSVDVPLTMNDDESRNEKTAKSDEVIEWLKTHLPSTCFISKDLESNSRIRIWIK